MSPNPNMAPEPPAAPAAPATPAAADAPKDYEALYRQAVAEQVAERERYKPFAQSYGALDQGSQQAILALAQAAAEGDTDAIAAWAEGTYKNLTGSEIAAKIAAAQQAPVAPAPMGGAPAPEAPAAPAGMTPEQVAEMVQQTIRREQMAQSIATELAGAGHTPESAAGRTILSYAQQTRLPIADAIAWYNNELAQNYARMVAGGQQVAAGTPPPVAGGAPAAAAAPATAKERALARLQGGRP